MERTKSRKAGTPLKSTLDLKAAIIWGNRALKFLKSNSYSASSQGEVAIFPGKVETLLASINKDYPVFQPNPYDARLLWAETTKLKNLLKKTTVSSNLQPTVEAILNSLKQSWPKARTMHSESYGKFVKSNVDVSNRYASGLSKFSSLIHKLFKETPIGPEYVKAKQHLIDARQRLADAQFSLSMYNVDLPKTAKSIAKSIKTSLMPLHNASQSVANALSEIDRLGTDRDPVVNTALDDVKRSLKAAETNLRFVMRREDDKRSKRANGLKY